MTKDRRSWASKEGLYLTSSWRKLRRQVLNERGTCVLCWSIMKKVTPATMVDHIEPITKENWEVLFLDKNNLQSLCWGCHYAKTNWDKVEQKFDKSGKDLMDDILSQ